MGKPRLIILLRHGQSEGNMNKAIHQTVPDHRVKLTPLGHSQSLQAGTRLLTLLEPTDTVQIITSPYTRTRQTTAGILTSLSQHPLSHLTRVHEEPRIREQDFGNFQPCAAEMKRIWHERAAYGHFFYRIPNGESAADAYDRVSGFNESLWRQFAEDDFPRVVVLVTHGLMARIFLMKWYHYSVEHFEDLRNIGHCESVVMELERGSGRYVLRTELKTWSAYRREQGIVEGVEEEGEGKGKVEVEVKYGGCIGGCEHGDRKGYNTMLQGVEWKYNLSVLEAGRDFGGSCSGAGSRVGSDDGERENEVERGDDEEVEESGEPSDMLEGAMLGRMSVGLKVDVLGHVPQQGDGGRGGRL